MAIVVDGILEGVVAEDGAVKFVLGEVAEVVIDGFGVDFEGFIESFAFGEFGKGGSTSNGRGAAVGFPANVLNCIGIWVHLDVHFHLVATDGVADQADGVGFKLRFVAHQKVTGIQKVILDNVGIYPILAFVHKMIIAQKLDFPY